MNASVNALCKIGFGAAVTLAFAAQAQQSRVYTVADYAQAEKFMSYNTAPLAYKGVVVPHWMPDGRFWYRAVDETGTTYRLVDPAKKTNVAAFDAAKLAVSLHAASGKLKSDASHLRLSDLAFTDADRNLHLSAAGEIFDCTLTGTYTCKAAEKASTSEEKLPPMELSPDGKKGAFIRDWNLWVRDVASGKETQLTTDGVKDYGYATDNAGWKHSDAAILLWSPDSKKIATFQQDQRKDGEMYLVPVTNTHPELKAWKYPLVGDENVTMIERVVIDVDAKQVLRIKMPPDQHRGSNCDDVTCRDGGNTWEDVEWSPDTKHLAFVSTARDHKQEWLRVTDTATGEVREVMTEKVPKFYDSGDGVVNWHYLPASNEILWFSERSNWGQLYLYDLTTGTLKNQITHGDGNVTQVLHVDEKARTIYFYGVGKEAGRDPYFVHLYSVRFDGSDQKLLTPEDANHVVSFSPDFRHFADVASTPTSPDVTSVRASTGALVMEVAKRDISKLVAAGWVPPVPITVKARDGQTDLFGMMFNTDELRCLEEVPDHQPHLSRAADGVVRPAQLFYCTWRPAVVGGTRFHRRLYRWDGNEPALEELSRGLLRQSWR